MDTAWWRGKRVLITGGSGFIGSHLVERLLPFCGRVVVPTRQHGTPKHLRHVSSDLELGHAEEVFCQTYHQRRLFQRLT